MTLEIRLRDEATEDLAEAASWYERQVSGLGHTFLDTAQTFLESIPENPLQYPFSTNRYGVLYCLGFRLGFTIASKINLSWFMESCMPAEVRDDGRIAHNNPFNTALRAGTPASPSLY